MECPQCKEPIVIGNVCPVCGYIIEDEVSGLSPRTLTDSIEQNLNFMKAVPDISLWSVFSNWMTWVMPFIAIGFAVMAQVGSGDFLAALHHHRHSFHMENHRINEKDEDRTAFRFQCPEE